MEYDGSEPWEEPFSRQVREAVEPALGSRDSERKVEETMAARANAPQVVPSDGREL